MKTVIVTFLCLFSLVTFAFSQSNGTAKPFTLQGKITGKDSGFIALKYVSDNNKITNMVEVKNGEFVFRGTLIEPTQAQILGGDELNSTYIFIEPGVMKVNLTKDKFADFEVTGSKTQDEWNELDLFQEPIYRKDGILKDQRSRINDSIGKTKDEVILKRLKNSTEEIDDQLWQSKVLLKTNEIKFIQSHPKSFLSGELLVGIDNTQGISLDSLKTIYNGLDTIIKNSVKGQVIKKDISKYEKSAVGAFAPDFKVLDLNTQPVTLSEYRGKNEVLMVFWASWCGNCRNSFPHLKEVFKKYHSKGLEIIFVSIDRDKEAWIAAVNQDSIGMWHQVHGTDKFGPGPEIVGSIVDNYFVHGIPDEVLIDKKGKIIGRYKGSNESMDEKMKELFKD